MKLLLLLFILLFTGNFHAQNSKKTSLDVLKKKIRQSTYFDSAAVFQLGNDAIILSKKMNLPKEEAIIYQFYGDFYFFSNQLDLSWKNYNKSIQLAKKHNDLDVVNACEIRKAFIVSDTDIFEAEKEFNRLLEISLSNGFYKNIIECYNGLGIISDNKNALDESMAFYLKALKIAEDKQMNYQIAIVLNNIGLIKLQNNQTISAGKDFEKALALAYQEEESRLAITLHNNLGLVNNQLKNYSESINHYNKTLKNSKQLGFPYATAVAFANLSAAYNDNKNYPKAIQYADSAIGLFKNQQSFAILGKSYLLKAEILTKDKNTYLARKYVDSMFLTYKNTRDLLTYAKAFDVLAEINEVEGDYASALKYVRRYNELSDSISEASNKDKMATLQVIYGKERVESQLEQETNKNTLLKRENELKKARIRTILIVAVFFFVLFGAIIYIRYEKKTRRQQAIFSQSLISSIDDERSRISRDLHDDIGQSLSIVKSKVSMFNSGKITVIDGLENEIGDLINQTRRISHDLHPAFLEKIGLSRSLSALLEKTQDVTGIICNLDLCKETDELPKEVKTQVYRIFQECINNSIKHARASALKLSVKYDEGYYSIKYKDNGIGIKDTVQLSGFGIMTIKERAKILNGKTVIFTNSSGFKLLIKFKK
jgi:signal transduction histidine kinase